MTDNEIIKAYELCHSDALCDETNCPFFAKCKTEDLSRYILDLINRQKAEIERLEGLVTDSFTDKIMIPMMIETAKAEAVKEVIETMKPWYEFLCVDKGDWCEQLDTHAYNLVKEMVGEIDV